MRRISKLRLRSVEESLNRRGAALIEDGLRTASIPDAGGSRLLLVRKLALGRIRADDSPSAVALLIEARMRTARVRAVHALSHDAPSANAVYFNDDLEPYTALALLVLRGQDAGAWFWRLAVPGWSPWIARDEALRMLLAGALASSAGMIAALQWIRRLVRHNAVDALAAALRPMDGPVLLRAFGWFQPRRALPVPDPDPRHAVLSPGANPPRDVAPPATLGVEIATPWILAWGAEDARSLWLACALLAVERPAMAAQPSLAQEAAAWIAAGVAVPHHPRMESNRTEPTIQDAGTAPFAGEMVIAAPAVRRPSERAGLFFLVQAMRILGVAQWLAGNPDSSGCEFPLLVLREIAARLETAAADPGMAALGEPPEEVSPAVAQAVREWIRRLRRFARLTARIGLHSLICRPGLVVFTKTHIDVMFRLGSADIRVRRAGLDIDPGWMPWLGRVVHFHYLGDDAYDD